MEKIEQVKQILDIAFTSVGENIHEGYRFRMRVAQQIVDLDKPEKPDKEVKEE